jgi:two-component system, chemotaxis family, protein-glutamate methylesterase/glutaminase
MSVVLLREGRPLSLKEVDPSTRGPAVRPRHAVGLAASAGGLAALTEVLCSLPPDFPAPVLIVQHLSPDRRSFLAEILDRRCALPVVQVRGGERLEAGRVYVAPPGRHLLVWRSGLLSLSDVSKVQHCRPSADVLFLSLSAAWREQAIVVVLTGTGRDGADGVRAVKRRGGTVLAQDEASSEFFGMPDAAFRTGKVDQVLPLDGIAPALVELTAS